MYLKSLEIAGFKSFAKKSSLEFSSSITAIVGPNGSGKSNVAEAFRFVLGEQSIKSMRGKRGEDLIFNGTGDGGRLNRASVKVVFDNQRKILPLDFDEVSIERVVHRDSVNQYLINSSEVRLKDIGELLAAAHIGASGHHIISQGEADRILSANIKERRSMIEDALGLKVFQNKKIESERKLEKTKENVSHVEGLRKEIAPHLRFLKKQVEKIEQSRNLRKELVFLYHEYLKREDTYIKFNKRKIENALKDPIAEIKKIEEGIVKAKSALGDAQRKGSEAEEVIQVQTELVRVREESQKITREIGKLEGEITSLERVVARKSSNVTSVSVSLGEIEALSKEIELNIENVEKESSIDNIRNIIRGIRDLLRQFIKSKNSETTEEDSMKIEIDRLSKLKADLDIKYRSLISEEKILSAKYDEIRNRIEQEKTGVLEAEKEMLRLTARQNEIHSSVEILRSEEGRIIQDEEEFRRELKEAGVLAGIEAIRFDGYEVKLEDRRLSEEEIATEDRKEQIERRRKIERIKIKVEELGGGSSDEILKEFRDVEERDVFLAKEIDDLNKSAQSLELLIKELAQKIDNDFKEGIVKINKAFDSFFDRMFGGGKASLKVVKEIRRRSAEEDEGGTAEAAFAEATAAEEGIDIEVSLPHKRIKGLMMLSGGERALTSIALIFAVSQVNPPPFIILDETDAALDEANSKKYGDMLQELAKSSQLIVITHNRETMSRASVLYGVTMGQGGVSKLLSVKFEEAVAVAK